MSQWLSPSDLRNKLLNDILQQQKDIRQALMLMNNSLTILNDQIYSMRGDQEEYKDEICSAITLMGIKSHTSSICDDIDHPAVGFTEDNRKVFKSEGSTQTSNDYEGATRDK